MFDVKHLGPLKSLGHVLNQFDNIMFLKTLLLAFDQLEYIGKRAVLAEVSYLDEKVVFGVVEGLHAVDHVRVAELAESSPGGGV